MKKIKSFFTLAFFAFALLSKAQTTTLVQNDTRKVVVTGSSEMEVDPDEIYVNYVLREYQNKQKVKIGIEEIKKEFLDACSKSGIPKENIRVEGVAGNGMDNWYIRKRRKENDFIATITYIIKFSSTKLIDDLVPRLNDEAVSNMYISSVSHSKMEEFRKQVKIKATIAAKEKAAYLAESVGEKIGSAILIEEIDNSGAYPMMMKSNMVMMDAMGTDVGQQAESMPFQKIKIRFETHAEFKLQ